MLRRPSLLTAAILLTGTAGSALADEYARVISSTPVVQQVPVTRQVCGTQQVVTQQQNSGAGALMGAVAGGAIGNSVGRGSGRAVATMIGLVGGAALGDQIEGRQARVQNVQQCSNQTVYENQTAWDVVYEYGGQRYNVQMPHDPGPALRLQVQAAPVQAPVTTVSSYATVVPAAAPTVVYTQPVYAQPYAPVYVAPAYAYPPVGVSLNLGWTNWRGGDHGGWHHGGHWR